MQEVPLKIALVDDHGLVRDLLVSYLSEVGLSDVVACQDVQELDVHLASGARFDVILLDYSVPGLNGTMGFRDVIGRANGSNVVLFSGTANRNVVDEVMSIGAAGYIPKTLTGRSLVNALKFVASGERYLPAEFVTQKSGTTSTVEALLNDRELRILNEICNGRANKEIANKFEMSLPTTKTVVRSICKKLNADNRTHAAMIARREGFGG